MTVVVERPADALGTLVEQPADALLGLIALHRADLRADKIDLGIGVFRDDTGATPVMRSVKAAEAVLLSQQATKAYLGAEGDIGYAALLAKVALGDALAASPHLAGVQTPGGTGALRLGAELLKRARPEATVWIGTPTWPNHGPIFAEAGLKVQSHRFYDIASARIDFDAMLDDLARAQAGDVLLLHGCCHNPTGAGLADNQWRSIIDLCDTRGLIPFVDLAYQGLGDGLDEDAAATRALFRRLPSALLAYSCDKNFGLYRERVGALWVQSASPETARLVHGNLLSLARSLWSMPPDHGAAIVRIILEDDALRADWITELTDMRTRINGLRQMLAKAHSALDYVGGQRGMFAMLPIDGAAVVAMREQHGVYMAGNGRINIAGLNAGNILHFVAGLATCL